MEYTGFTELGKCPICKKEKLCYEIQDDEGYCMLVCEKCGKDMEEDD